MYFVVLFSSLPVCFRIIPIKGSSIFYSAFSSLSELAVMVLMHFCTEE